MLFFCVWPDEASFLCDVASRAAALAAATEHVGVAPADVRPVPCGVFAADVHFEQDDDADDDETIALDLLPHVEVVLTKLEDELTPEEETAPRGRCASEGEDEGGKVARCELEAHGDDTPHRGEGLTW